jgi:hypothetical protein
VASPLNNPWVVGGLVLGGACYALYTLVPADWLERLGGTAQSKAVPPPLNVVAPQSLGPDNRFFIARPSGVPGPKSEAFTKTGFAWDIFYENPKAGLARGPKPLPADWKLTGIYLDEKRQPPVRAAVVSGDILKPGSKKGEFVVEEITADSVVFGHPSGRQTLTFPADQPAKKK